LDVLARWVLLWRAKVSVMELALAITPEERYLFPQYTIIMAARVILLSPPTAIPP
jgi:hypothetical protein